MQTLPKALIFSLLAAALATPGYAAPMGGGSGWSGGGGGAILPSGGGGSGPPAGGFATGPGPGGRVSGGPASNGAPAPHWQGAPNPRVTPPGKTGAWTSGKPSGGGEWRRHRHPWPGGYVWTGPYYYTFGDYYDDETDVNHCWVYRKAYNRQRQFLGWKRVNICVSQ